MTTRLRWWFTPLLAPDTGTGAAPSAGAAPPAPPSDTGGGQASGGGAPSPYRPDGLPDHYFGTSNNETIDKLWGALGPGREAIGKLGELGKLPRDAGGYEFEASDKLKPFLPDVAGDPVLKMVREAAHKAGIRDKQFAPFLTGVLEAMVDGDLVTPAVDLAAEKAALLPEEAKGLDEAQQNAAIDRRVRDNHARIEIWKTRGLPAESAEALAQLLDTAAGNRLAEYFAEATRTPQPSPGGTATGGFTHEDVKARANDPRSKPDNAKYDPAYVAETDRMYRVLFPN